MSNLVWQPVKIRLGQVEPWTDNPRMSTKAQAERLIQSERELGQVQTIAIGPANDAGKYPLYDGHQRYAAWFTVKGAEYELTALQSNRPLTEDERRKMSILLHTATGGWNWDKMAGWQVGELKEWGLVNQDNIKGWNNDANNVKELLKAEEETADAEPQVDRAAELLEKWKVKTGDLWQIGEHRLLCGDSTKAEDIQRLMQGERAQMCFTDPPYGVNFADAGGTSVEGDISYAIIPLFFATVLDILDDRAWLYVCGGQTHMALFSKMFEHYLKQIPKTIVWDKVSPIMRRNGYQSSFEFIYYGFTKGAGDWWFGSRAGEASTDVWHVPTPSGEERTHLTQKPVDLPARAIGNTCPPDGIVYEPFSGTGAVLVACENLKRKCRAVEQSPAYVAVTLERMATAFPGIEIKRI